MSQPLSLGCVFTVLTLALCGCGSDAAEAPYPPDASITDSLTPLLDGASTDQQAPACTSGTTPCGTGCCAEDEQCVAGSCCAASLLCGNLPDVVCCGSGQTCGANGKCEGTCKPSCAGKTCGSDGCGGSCGTCTAPQTCNDAGKCVAPAFIRAIYLQVTSYWDGTKVKLTAKNLAEIKQAGITDIYAQVRFTSTGSDGFRKTLKPIVQFFKGSGMRVHAWTCPSNYNPTDNSDGSINQKVLQGVTEIYAGNYGMDGVVLDEFYFGGTAPKYSNAAQYVTDFHKKVFAVVKAHGGIATTCTTPEYGVAKSVYGVDYAALGQHCHYLTPMAYTDDFASGRVSYVGEVVKAIQAKTTAAVFPSLETYKGDKHTDQWKSVATLNAEITSGVNAGAKGYALFRYGMLTGWPTAGP